MGRGSCEKEVVGGTECSDHAPVRRLDEDQSKSAIEEFTCDKTKSAGRDGLRVVEC